MLAQPEPRVLVAGVGHRLWRDCSAGMVWLERIQTLPWPDHVTVDDYGFGAIAMMQRLQDERYDTAVFLTAESRGRVPGTLDVRRHLPALLEPEKVQEYVGEAGAGVVAIDPLLAIAQHFGALPPATWVVEVEPEDTGWGEGLSPQVEALFPRVVDAVRAIVEASR